MRKWINRIDWRALCYKSSYLGISPWAICKNVTSPVGNLYLKFLLLRFLQNPDFWFVFYLKGNIKCNLQEDHNLRNVTFYNKAGYLTRFN